MKLVIAEKPSVARDLASFLGAKKKCDGYFEGNGYLVTWAFGHLVALKEPDEYKPEWKKWSLGTLPIVPDVFELKLTKNAGVAKQFQIIKQLIQKSSHLICATDAGREGELIFRYILSLAGEDARPFDRLWLSSLTDEAIGKAFKELKKGSSYNNLYAAAKCRSESDWIVGLNATRYFTVRYGRGVLWSVGRVQTPVLTMIIQKDDEIRSFVSKPFWELRTKYKDVIFKYKGERFEKKEDGEAFVEKLQKELFYVEKIEAKKEKANPPLLYDLTELQKDMNKEHGLCAQDTLSIAQQLYESKWISYPRTDSKFLTTDMKKEVPLILKSLGRKEVEGLNLASLSFSSRIIDDKKAGEHHAIIPTGKKGAPLSGQAKMVFDAIATRLIAVFYPPCEKSVKTVHGRVLGEKFQAKGVQILHLGWQALYGQQEKEDLLPSFTKGESGPHAPFVKEGKTEPPKHFTEATLLGAMETAGKFVEDEVLKEALKAKGIGTPATRASIIEVLLKRGYIIRDKKIIRGTDLGRYLVALIRDPALKSPELTGEWEAKLKEIEKGARSAEQFMQEIVAYTKGLLAYSAKKGEVGGGLGSCPKCKKGVIEGKKGYGCSNWKEGCTFVLWKEHKGIFLSKEMVKELLAFFAYLTPVSIEGKKVLLYLSPGGDLLEAPIPQTEAPGFSSSKRSQEESKA